jgi:hypothetical protein
MTTTAPKQMAALPPLDLSKCQEYLTSAISHLKDLASQWSKIESMDAENARAKVELDHTTKLLAQTKGEVKENEHWRDKYLGEARDKAAESERLDKEIAEKRVVVRHENAPTEFGE